MNLHSITFPFIAEDLPYPYDALEPYIDTESLYYHKRIFDTYIERLNTVLAPYPEYYNWTLEQLLTYIGLLPPLLRESICKYGGGVYNHILYFQCLGGDGVLNPETPLGHRIEENFNSFDNFKKLFSLSAQERFGSGYTYLVQPIPSNHTSTKRTPQITDSSTSSMNMAIISTANQISPLTFHLYPILCIDVWEHAYYLKHKNIRKNYIEDWFSIINWTQTSTYEASDLNQLPLPYNRIGSSIPVTQPISPENQIH